MSNNHTRQAGFGASVITLVALVVLVIGGVGVVVFKKSANTKQATTTTSTPDSKDTVADPNSQPEATKPHVLTVKEWGIQIPLPESVKDAYYVVSTSTGAADGSPNKLWIGLKSLDSLGCDAAKANTGGKAMASVIRTKPTDTDPVHGKLYTELRPNGVTIDGYYYSYVTVTPYDCVPAAKLAEIDTAFKTAIKDTTKADATTQ